MNEKLDYTKMRLHYPLMGIRDSADNDLYLSPDTRLGDLLELAEKHVYQLAIERCKHNQVICAKALGVSRGTLRTKLRYYFGDLYFRGGII